MAWSCYARDIQTHAGNTQDIAVILDSLLLISKLFYSLNFQVLMAAVVALHVGPWELCSCG